VLVQHKIQEKKKKEKKKREVIARWLQRRKKKNQNGVLHFPVAQHYERRGAPREQGR
jgi:hypothetical protein